MRDYLQPGEYVDSAHPDIVAAARELAAGAGPKHDVVRRCFEFVRDSVRHSVDYKLNPVTCRASEVLRHRTGYCYAKSHLLAAL
ncbi:MAG TPA: transglutaminase domain-containing protein, partial [Telluria sp.]|nr:transglutaminase domain-containing protein [Telluria sp.]